MTYVPRYGAKRAQPPADPVADATLKGLRTLRTDHAIPVSIDGWETVLNRAAQDPAAARDLLRCLAGPAGAGARAVRNQSAIFESAVGACLKYQQGIIDNANMQNRITPEPEWIEIRDSAQEKMGTLRTAIDAARKALPKAWA